MKKDLYHLCHDGLSRREFVRLASIAGALGATGGLLAHCSGREAPASTSQRSQTATPRLKIGYLPITDATPLLIGHAKQFFEAEGLTVDRPVMIRGWAELSE